MGNIVGDVSGLVARNVFVSSGGGASAWLPTDVESGTLERWHRAKSDDSSYTKNGSTISQWDDESGNDGHFTQVTAASQPTWDTETLNSYNVLDFDGTDDKLTSDPCARSEINIFLVKKSTDNRGIDVFNSGSQYGPAHDDGSAATSLFVGVSGTVTYWKNGETETPSTRDDLHTIYHDGNANIVGYTGFDNTNWTTKLDFWGFGGWLVQGQVAEIILVSGTLSTADRQKIEGYLAHKYALNWQLPSDHPYYTDGSLFGFSNLWQPSDLSSGLEVWLDPSDASTITESAGAVSQIDDKSGNSNHFTQPTSSKQFNIEAETLNSLRVLDNNGDDDLDSTSAVTDSVVNFIFIKKASDTQAIDFSEKAAVSEYIFPQDSGSSSTVITSNSGTPDLYVDGTNQNIVHGTTTRADLHSMLQTGSYVIAGIIGADLTQWTAGIQTGYSPNTAFDIVGQYAEIIIVSSTLSTADRQTIEGYLAHKWGLTANLDAGHPYKSSPPTA